MEIPLSHMYFIHIVKNNTPVPMFSAQLYPHYSLHAVSLAPQSMQITRLPRKWSAFFSTFC